MTSYFEAVGRVKRSVTRHFGNDTLTHRQVARLVPAFAGTGILAKVCHIVLITAVAAVTACTFVPEPSHPDACIIPIGQRMLVAELFFGRNVPGQGSLSEAEWRAFAAEVVTPNFPDGFTAFDGEGQWRNPATGGTSRQPTKILLVAAKRTPDLAARLSAVTESYKTRYQQQSVGLITRDSCAAF
jgi:hypothetical protein